jgi:3-methyladenine DNA glycosylase AlkD
MRKVARRFSRTIVNEQGVEFLVQVADDLFRGAVLEEKVFAVLLLQGLTGRFKDREFRRFESWLSRISSWADHDGLVHYLIAPMVASKPSRVRRVFTWAKSSDRWHRRAACVALIRGTRRRLFSVAVMRLSNTLLRDNDDMVQKGLGWLLRETAKADPEGTIPYLMKIRQRAPRLVLRTACETLNRREREKILVRQMQARVDA